MSLGQAVAATSFPPRLSKALLEPWEAGMCSVLKQAERARCEAYEAKRSGLRSLVFQAGSGPEISKRWQ